MKRGPALTRLLAFALLLLLAAAIQSCAPAAPTIAPSAEKPAAAPTAVPATKPAEAQTPQIQSTQAAAAPAPTATAPAKASPAAAEPSATAAPVIEERIVELEWPSRLRLGDSDFIRLSLTPATEGYVATVEMPDHTVQTRPVVVPRPEGYALYAVARLDGVAFEIDPRGDQERLITLGETLTWRWTLTGRSPGNHRLSVQLRLRWSPEPGVSGSAREAQAFSRPIDLQVTSFLGLSPAQAAPVGAVGMLAGSGLFITAVVSRRARRAPEKHPAGPALQVVVPEPGVGVETPAGVALSEQEHGLMSGLFHRYARLVIENEFLSGYSGARTFLVHPIRADGRGDASTIVKIGPREAIQREYENYEQFVKDRLPPMTARIQRPPAVLAAEKPNRLARAAVQYTFIAEPGRSPASLRQALLRNPDPGLLLQMFETFGPGWWMQRSPYSFRAGVEYDRLLPPHYVLKPVDKGSEGAPVTILSMSEISTFTGRKAGDLVRVQPFPHAELRADGQTYSLAAAPLAGRPALRVRWLGTTPPSAPVTARIVATRMDLLRGWTVGFERYGMDDPLNLLERTLEETISGTRSVIHGDLNLENVLSGPGSLVWLIDFAQTREGHPLFDFAHLESEIIAHILAPRAGSAKSFLELWQSGDEALTNTMGQIAGRCLFDPAHPREYHLALFLSCLGALKYQNIPQLAKHCLFLAASDIGQNILRQPDR